ncbi:MAG: DUF484 family protein [Rhodospirillaceae bacterium]|jgi:uncharacterized protein|nr:DUF484 family protein [Rhodospirillaceae bacterium]MBT5243766.1 DUF484 family protein [Rhodospirillaceae bacterium]MBT5563863.1 DUF484 family protein [Rhodospirillaceae bacterium]MBT6241648.1 DUF484 family protein [Rhodospirillaceae bacterium]MBT7136546.1 DUF484 family protein [Rhodospirillaceae bacterium]
MSGLKNDAASEASRDLSEEQVSDFLSENPDFLTRNPEVLKNMMAPSRWSGDGVADMQQFMLEQLRGEIDNLRDCAQDVIETSRTNMSIQTRTHTAVLALLSATNFNQLIRVISEDFPLLLDIDVTKIGFEPANTPGTELMSSGVIRFLPGDVERHLGPDQDVLLMRDVADDGGLFGEGAGLVHSAALARLRPGHQTPPGLLALGSRGSAFYPGQGTELIGFLARVLERCIDKCLVIKT